MKRTLACLIALAVTSPAFASGITLTPASQTVTAGNPATLTVTIDAVRASALPVYVVSLAPECAMVTLQANLPMPPYVPIPAGSTSADFSVLVTSSACGDVRIRAFTSETADALLHVVPAGPESADLSTAVRFTSLTQEVHHGSTINIFHFEAELRNAGPADATNARLLVSLPCSATLFDTISSSCPRIADAGGPTLGLCRFDAIPAGETRVATVSVSNPDCAFTARGTASEVDPEPANDIAKATMPTLVDVSVSIAAPESARAGDKVTHTITVRNLSPHASATGVHTFSSLPMSAELLSVTPSRGQCTIDAFITRSISCELGTLEPLSAITIVVATIPSDVGFQSTSVSANEPDAVRNNNWASISYPVLTPIPLLSPAALLALALALAVVGAGVTRV